MIFIFKITLSILLIVCQIALASEDCESFFDHPLPYVRSSTKQGKIWVFNMARAQEGFYVPPLWAPEAPHIVTYNWQNTNFENLTNGFSIQDLRELLRFDNPAHMGLYLSTDPYYYSYMGEVVMEVLVYQHAFPIQKDGQIRWVKIEDQHFSVDFGSGGDGSWQQYAGATQGSTYVISDLRVIKAIRYPSKEMVLKAWLEPEGTPSRMARQWLLTPNYSFKERLDIVEKNPERMIDFMRNEHFIIPNSFFQTRHLSAIEAQNAFEALMGIQGNYVDVTNSVIDYQALMDAMEQVPPERIQWIATMIQRGGENRRILQAFELALSAYQHKHQKWEKIRKKMVLEIESDIQFSQENMVPNIDRKLRLAALNTELENLNRTLNQTAIEATSDLRLWHDAEFIAHQLMEGLEELSSLDQIWAKDIFQWKRIVRAVSETFLSNEPGVVNNTSQTDLKNWVQYLRSKVAALDGLELMLFNDLNAKFLAGKDYVERPRYHKATISHHREVYEKYYSGTPQYDADIRNAQSRIRITTKQPTFHFTEAQKQALIQAADPQLRLSERRKLLTSSGLREQEILLLLFEGFIPIRTETHLYETLMSSGIDSKALISYTEGSFGKINHALRNDIDAPENRKKIQEVLHVFQALPSYRNPVFRRVTLSTKDLRRYRVGRKIVEKAFISTSKVPWSIDFEYVDEIKQQDKNIVLMIIQGTSGRDISQLSTNWMSDGQEVLFPPGRTFNVIARSKQHGIEYITLEEVQ